MPTTYYKVHGGRLTVAEYWRMSPNLFSFLVAAGLKPFGGFPFNFSIPRIDELHYVEWDDLPGFARRRMRERVEQLESVGFERIFCYESPFLEEHRLGVATALLAADGRTFAVIPYFRDDNVQRCEVSCVSRFEDETLRGVTTTKKELRPIPEHISFRYPGLPADVLYERHQEHLRGWENDGGQSSRLTREVVADEVLAVEQRTVDFHAERGVFVPMTPGEIRRIRAAQDEKDDER